MDNQKMTGGIFIDLKKAFDLVDHHCLLLKLEYYGIRGQSYNWFANYLAERSQRTKYRGELSYNLPLHHGVPQSSILGPLLFVLYINDLPQCLSKSQISMYADDTVIYFSGTKSCKIEVTLQSDINKVEQWLLETKVLLFGTIQKLVNVSSFNVKFQDQVIERVSKFIYLGITLDENLNWKEHVDTVCIKANKCLSLLARIRPCLNLKASKCV